MALNPVRVSGSVMIRKDGSDMIRMDIHDSVISATIMNDKIFKDNVKRFPAGVKKLKVLHRISGMMNDFGITLELKYRNESILKMGKGIKSLIGNVKINILRAKEYV